MNFLLKTFRKEKKQLRAVEFYLFQNFTMSRTLCVADLLESYMIQYCAVTEVRHSTGGHFDCSTS